MKPFDLEAAKRGDPIVCRDGTPAKFIAHVPEAHATNRLIVLVLGNIYGSYESGKWGPSPEKFDLFMAPKKRTVWVNLYANGEASYHDSEESARDAKNHVLHMRAGGKAYPVEIEE